MKNLILVSFFSISFGLSNAQIYSPIPVTGFNQDVVAEGTGSSAQAATSVEMDAVPISNFVLCTREFATTNSFLPANTYGLPDEGLFVDGIRTYQWAPYEEANVLYLYPTETGTLNLINPAHYTNISLLALSTEGSSTVSVTFNFSDGSSQTNSQPIFDWFNNVTSPFNSYGRVKRKDGPFTSGTDYAGAESGKPVFATLDFTIPCNKSLNSITIKNTSSTTASSSFRSFILAVSGLEIILNPTISAAASDTTICSGKPVTFSSSITNGGTIPSYAWKVNGITKDTNSFFTTSILNNNDLVTCELTSNLPCASPPSVTSKPIRIQVNPVLVPSIATVASDTIICKGTSITFSATPTNGGNNPLFIWRNNGVTVGNTATFSGNQFEDNDQISCILVSNALCASPLTATSLILKIHVSPRLTPALVISASDTSVCKGTTITFNSTSTYGGTAPSFQWLVNNIQVGSNSNQFSTSSLSNDDEVKCQITSNEACLTKTSDTSNTIDIQVTPVFELSIALIDTLNANGSPYPLAGTPPGGIFTQVGVNIGMSFNPVSFGPGIHQITYSLPQNTCSLPVTKEIIVRQLPCDLNPETVFTPNGDGKNDYWEIGLFNSNCILRAEVDVFNRWGKSVFSSKEYANDWDGKEGGNALSDGVYFFTIRYSTVGNAGTFTRNGTVLIVR